MGPSRDIVSLLRLRAEEEGPRRVFTFQEDRGDVTAHRTYEELDQRARSLAVWLRSRTTAGDRALLLYPQGLEFIEAFFGCLYAGVVAVPLPPPDETRRDRTLPRIRSVVQDAAPRVVLTTTGLEPLAKSWLTEVGYGGEWLATDRTFDGDADAWQPPTLDEKTLAYLQYTSGSTAAPKGVMVHHGNLTHNARVIRDSWGYTPESVAVMWVPNFHDDGLIHGTLGPVVSGCRSILLAPTDIVRRPAFWLEMIHRHRGTHSGGPNFIYALCAAKVDPATLPVLDLGSWRMAYNAAEPVRAETLDLFAETFGPYGFRRDALFPSFGLAEATLLVTTRALDAAAPTLLTLDGTALEQQGRVVPSTGGRQWVSCGHPVADTELAIVDPETGEAVAPGTVGELWIRSPSVAAGYWRQEEKSAATFGASLQGREDETFLRTGDLGFLVDGELYITGRHKDLIIVRGRNLYPQDIELTVERSHPDLRPGCGAAVMIEVDGEERLAVIQEVRPKALEDPETVVSEILAAVFREHEVPIHTLALLAPGTIAKTSSGKIQRQANRKALHEGTLEIIHRWTSPQNRSAVASPTATDSPTASATPAERTEELLQWLRSYADERLEGQLQDSRRALYPALLLDFSHRGLFALQLPEALAGHALSHRDTLRIFEQLAAIDLSIATLVVGHNALGLRPVTEFAPAALRDRLLPELATGRRLTAFALSEPGAGSNPRAITTTAKANGQGGWQLDGTKMWIGSASLAGVFHVFAQSLDSEGRRMGMTAFAVPRERPGIHLGPEAPTLGLRGMAQSTVEFRAVQVGPEDLLGEVGSGLTVARDAMSYTRYCLAALSLGAMKRCAQLMVRFAGRRQVATGRLLDNPVSRHRLGELRAAIDALEALLHRVASALDAGVEIPETVSAALKIAGPELLGRAADDLVQMLGGRGYVENNPAARILRDARVYRIFEGPTETLAMHLGSELVHGDGACLAFLRRHLRANALADRLEHLAADAMTRLKTEAPEGDRAAALQWGTFTLGHLATEALLLAAVEAAGDAANTTTLAWVHRRFEEAARHLMELTEEPLPSAASIEETVAHYATDIGDVELHQMHEDFALDSLLRRGQVESSSTASVGSVRQAASAAAPVQAVPAKAAPPKATRTQKSADTAPDAPTIHRWVAAWLGRELGVTAHELEADRPFAAYGLDSVTGVALADALSRHFDMPVDETVAWEYPTLSSLAAHLGMQETSHAEPATSAATTSTATQPATGAEEEDLGLLLAELESLSEEDAEEEWKRLQSGGTET